MGKLVSAVATSHTFGLPDNHIEATERVAEGMREIGRRVRAAKPDILIIVSSDHLTNFDLDVQIPFAVGMADGYEPLGDLGVPVRRYPGNRGFAAGLVQFASNDGFDLVGLERVRPDHGIAVPNAMINVHADVPLVPLYINTVMETIPTCKRSYELGRVVARYIREQRPNAERVAIVGSGGLSHWICMPDSGRINEEWDRGILDRIACGQGRELATWTPASIIEAGGNGGLEIAAWACMLGAAGDATGSAIYYEPMHNWWTGMGGVAMHIDAA
ncbi:hypothetical protein [Pigmentiphaga sp.]|uniref:DODA-type extradiol aromatic ring-opening family dioxygenase n=1 Tax=Pigmentiphaga sp. TaxID=1977564 RepID=UPI0025F2E01A|nr:hypothetical protein [Pigmentiphaga sp.]